MVDPSPRDPRRLLLLFMITTLAPAGSLGWLAWRMVEQDRMLEARRVQEKRDQAADLAAAALRRLLAEAEEKLTNFSASRRAPGSSAGAGDGVALMSFDRQGAVSRGGVLLPFYPAAVTEPASANAELAGAEEMEFRQEDFNGALRLLRELANRGDPVLRGEAMLRMGRIHRKIGNLRQALDVFAELGGLRGRQGRALLWEAAGRKDELQREAAALCDDLEQGRWLLRRSEFFFAYQQARGWLSEARPPIRSERLALAGAAGTVWQEWVARTDQPANARSRRTIRAEGQPLLVLTRTSPDRMAAWLGGSAFLRSAWLKELRSGTEQGIEFALTDAEGAFAGSPDAPLALQSVRPASATQLPWTVHAISRDPGAGHPELSGRTRLLLAAIALMAVMVVAGGYLIQRAMLREVKVARLQSDFVAAVSHEFRTPLTTLRQLSEMLVKGRVSTDERRQQFYQTLLSESERLHRLVEGLLNFGAMESGKLQYRFEPVDTDSFLRGIVRDFEREVSALGYRVELEREPSLPAIRADRESLACVFWNLLDNAVKYSPENRTVWVDASSMGKRLAVRVRDRGVGIPAGEQQQIFRKFVRGAGSKAASIRGTGVGLAIARQIVSAHGGDITVESQAGEGSVFTVLLPVAEV